MVETNFTFKVTLDALLQHLEQKPEARAALCAVMVERARQDEQWGGPAHDDGHRLDDWLEYIKQQVRLARMEGVDQDGRDDEAGGYLKPERVKARLLKIAALAVAGAESIDRKTAAGDYA